MFKLLRLEDRIVLDGAAMDAIHQKEQQDSHQYDLIMQAQGGHVSDHHLTPDAHQADVGVNDSGHDGTHTDLDTHQPLFLAEVTDSQDSGLHVLVISSNIKDADTLAAAAKDDVMVIRYDAANTDIDDLAALIHNALGGKKADSIAFATHNGNAGAELNLTGTDITSSDTLSDPRQQAFWKSVGSDVSDNGRIDLLACNVTMDTAGEQFVSDLQNITGKTVAASSDLTGSASHGGDWVLETGNVDVKKVYFDDHKIDNYDGVLAPINHFYNATSSAGGFNILDNQSAEKGVYTRFSFSADTFHNLSGDAITYTVTGKPTWLTWYATDRVFYGTPKNIPGGAALQSSYTITVNATDAFGGSDTLSFTLKVANVTDSGQDTPSFVSGDPTNEFFITEGTPVGTHLTPDMPIVATDSNTTAPGALAGYRFVAPTGATIPFTIGSDGTISSASSSLTPGKYYYTVEAYDGTGYQDTSHIIVNVQPAPKPGAWLTFNQSSFAENGGTVTLTANLTMSSAAVTTLQLNFAGTATSADYLVASNQFITIPSGLTTNSMTITGQQDILTEVPNETIVVSITGPAGINVPPPAQYTPVTATIVDNTPPQVALSLSNSTFSEKGGTTVLTAAIAGGATASTDLHVNLSFGGQATLNTDYSVTNTMITIPAGQASAAITVMGLKDTPFDPGDETVIFTGTSTDAPINPASSTLTATLKNFDFASQPTVTLEYKEGFMYENKTSILSAKLTNTTGVNTPITVYFSFSETLGDSANFGTDYNASPSTNTIVIPAMSPSADITIIGQIDGDTEGQERIRAEIDTAKTVDANIGTPSVTDIYINDYIVPKVHLSLATGATVLEGTVASTPIKLTLEPTTGNPTEFVSVYLNQVNTGNTASPSWGASPDYRLYYDSGLSQAVEITPDNRYMVTFTPGLSEKTLYVSAMSDDLIEGPETITYNVLTAGFAATTSDIVTMTIVDEDKSNAMLSLTLPTATFAESVTAGNSTVLNLTLSEAIQGVVTANLNYSGTAVLGTDFTVSGTGVTVNGTSLTVTIPSVNNIASVTLIGNTDSVFDPYETASFTLDTVTNAGVASPSAVTATIVDTNKMSVQMSFSSTFGEKSPNNTTILTITPSGDPIQSGSTVNMYLMPHNSASYGYATPSTDYTVSIGGSALTPDTAGYYSIPFTQNSTATITLTGVTDSIVEPAETVGFGANFTPSMTGTLGYASTLLMNDTTAGPGLNVWLGTIGSFNENGGTATMKVFMDHAVASDTIISLAYGGAATYTAGGTPADTVLGNTDYTVAGGKDTYGKFVTILAGQTVATLTFTAISDGSIKYYEGYESISVSVQPSGTGQYTVGALPLTATVTGTIIEAQEIPAVTLTYASGYSSTFPENPNVGNGLLALNIPYPSQLNSTVNLTYSGSGSNPAVLNTDYTAQTMGIIMAGQTSGNVPLTGNDDPLLEPNETFQVSVASVVSNGGAAVGSSPGSLLATVMDDDATRGAQVYILPPGFSGVNSSGQFLEGNTNGAVFTVGLDRSVSNEATVNLAFGGKATYGSLNGPDYTVGYSVGGTFQAASVDPSTGKMQMIFPYGASTANVTVYAKADNYFEITGETVTVKVADAVAGTSPIEPAKFMTDVPVYTATIMDTNTDAPKVSIVPIISTFAESGLSTGQFAVRLDKIMSENVTVNLAIQGTQANPSYSADAKYYDDYQADQSYDPGNKLIEVVIPANASQTVVNLLGTPNELTPPTPSYEGNELVHLTIDSSGDVASGKVSITTGTNSVITLTEIESLAPPKVTMSLAGGATFGESYAGMPIGGISTTLNVYLSNPSVSDTYVALEMGGTLPNHVATGNNIDYSASIGTSPLSFANTSKLNVLIPAGSTQSIVTLFAVTDGIQEGDEYLSPMITTNSASGSPYTFDNTTSPVPKITLIDADFTSPKVYIKGVLAGTEIWEDTSEKPRVVVDLGSSVQWSAGLVGVVELTLGGTANFASGTSGPISSKDYSLEVQMQGSSTWNPLPVSSSGQVSLSFTDAGQTRAIIRFTGIEDGIYEPDPTETVFLGISTSGNSNIVPSTANQNFTLLMKESLGKPTVSLALSNATLYESTVDGGTNKSATVSVLLSTPTSESLTISLELGNGVGRAILDTAGVSDNGLGTVDYLAQTAANGVLTYFTSGNVGATGGPWTGTFVIPAGAASWDIFKISAKDDNPYESSEIIPITVSTGSVHGNFGADIANAASISGVTATIAESDIARKPYIKMGFDTSGNTNLPAAYTYPGYFSEAGVGASEANGTNTMKLSLYLTDSGGTTLTGGSASATTVMLTFDQNGNMKGYDNPPDGATPGYTWPTQLQTWGNSNHAQTYGYAWDYTQGTTGYVNGAPDANGGIVTLTGYSSGLSHTAPGPATYTMLVTIPAQVSQYDIYFTGIKDGVLEGDEKIVVQIAESAGGKLYVNGANVTSPFVSRATLLDADMDSGPEVSLSFAQASFSEGGNVQLVAYFSEGSPACVQDSTVVVSFTSASITPLASFATDGSTTTSGEDFYAFGETGYSQAYIVIPRGATSGVVPLRGMNDGIYEGPEYVTASIVAATGAINQTASINEVTPVSATLVDADVAPTVTLAVSGTQLITEGDTPISGHSATVTLYLSKSAANTVTANLSFTNSGTAPQSGFATEADYVFYDTDGAIQDPPSSFIGWSDGYVLLAPTVTSYTFYISANQDLTYEGNEKLIVSTVAGSDGSFATPGATPTGTITISDSNRLDVLLSTTGTSAAFGENGGEYPFTFGLYDEAGVLASSPVVETITLTFTGSGSTADYSDYQVSNDGTTWLNVGSDGKLSLTIPAGAKTSAAYLKGVNDNVFEGNELVSMALVTASFNPQTLFTPITATIVDDDPAVYVKLALGNNISATSAAISENGGNTLVRAMLVGADGVTGTTALSDITVNLGFTAGNASSGQASMGADYTYGSSYIVIPAGYTEAVSPGSINAINENSVYEGTENFTVGIKIGADGKILGGGALPSPLGDAVKTVFIADDDPGPTVSIAINGTSTFAELGTAAGAATTTVTLYLSGNANYGASTSPSDEYVFLDISGIASYGASTQFSQGADFFLYDSAGAGYTIPAELNANGSKIGYKVMIPKGISSASYYLMGVDDSQGSVPKTWHKFEGPETLNISLGTQSSGAYYSNLQTHTSANNVTATVIDADDMSMARSVSLSSTVGSIAENSGTYSLDLQVATGAYPVTVNFQVIPSHTAAASYGQAMVASDGAAGVNGEDFDVQVLYNTTNTGYYTSGLSWTGGAMFSAGQTAGYFSLVIPSEGAKTAVQMKLGIFDDKLYEPDETFAINIVSVVGGVTGGFGATPTPALTATIVDNDQPVIKIEVDQSQPGMNDSRAPDWAAGHTFTVGATSPVYAVPKDGGWNGHYYMATTDGVNPVAATTSLTTGTVEPTWAIGATVTDGNIIWKDMGLLDQPWSAGMTVQTGTMIVPTDPKLNGHFYVATAVVASTAGASEPSWGLSGNKTDGTALNDITWTDMGGYNNYFVEGDTQGGGARYFKITKNVDTTDGVAVNWYLNTAPTAGHAASAGDYSFGSLISGTAILPAQAGSVVIPYDMTLTADNVAEANSNGYKDTDIVIGINKVTYALSKGAFTEAGLVAVNNNRWAASGDGVNPTAFSFDNTGAGAYAEKYVGIYDDDFYPGDTGTGANTPPVPLEPSMTLGGFSATYGYTVGSFGDTELTQGGVATFGQTNLYFKDIDQINLSPNPNVQDFNSLQYTVVTAPTKGTLFVDYDRNGSIDGTDNVLENGETFYEGAVQGVGTYGTLTYLHGGNEGSGLKDSFTFTVSDGTNVIYKGMSTSATSGPWVFGITAADKNNMPEYGNRVFWIDENVTGSMYTTASLGAVGYIATDHDGTTGNNNQFYPDGTTYHAVSNGFVAKSYIVESSANYGADGKPLFTLVQTPLNAGGDADGTQLTIQATSPLDYEGKQAHVVKVMIYDSSMNSTGGHREAYIQVKVNDKADDGYLPIGTIPPVTLKNTETLVYQIPSDIFRGDGTLVVTSFYSNPGISWLHFENETQSFWSLDNDPARPSTTADFVITVRATYYYQNGETKNLTIPVESSFTLHYSMASMDLDAVMDALQYLDTDGEQFLPADGDQVPVQDMMARGGAPADAAQEVSEVLALLDAEAYAFDEARA